MTFLFSNAVCSCINLLDLALLIMLSSARWNLRHSTCNIINMLLTNSLKCKNNWLINSVVEAPFIIPILVKYPSLSNAINFPSRIFFAFFLSIPYIWLKSKKEVWSLIDARVKDDSLLCDARLNSMTWNLGRSSPSESMLLAKGQKLKSFIFPSQGMLKLSVEFLRVWDMSWTIKWANSSFNWFVFPSGCGLATWKSSSTIRLADG